MNYKMLDFKDSNFEENFLLLLTSYQVKYVEKILQKDVSFNSDSGMDNSGLLLKEEKSKKIDLKMILTDFFLSPRYDNVLDILKKKK